MAEVKTKITIVDNATAKLNKINKAIQNMDKSFEKLSRQQRAFTNNLNAGSVKATQIAEQLNKVSITANAASSGVKKASQNVQNFSKSAMSAEHSTSLLISKLRRLASIYLGVMGAKAAIQTSDALTSAENRLGNLAYSNGVTSKSGQIQFSSETMDKIYGSANRAATGYHEMAANVSKAVTLAGNSFGDSLEQQIDNAIVFQEIMAKTYALGGASAAEQASSMYQLTQALGSGILAGDELRSVREGAPLAYKQIETFAQGLLHTTDSLKDMASESLITSDIVVAAILDMEEKTNDAFANIDLTFAQLWTIFKNDTKKAFEPFLQTLREIANSEDMAKIMSDVTKFVQIIGATFTWLAQVTQSAIGFIADNWEAVKAVLLVIGSAVAVIVIAALQKAAIAGFKFAASLVTANLSTIVLVAGIASLVYWIYSLAQSTGDVASAIGQVLMYIAGVLAVVAAVAMKTGIALAFGLSAPMLFWIAIIALAIAAFFMFTEEICGAVAWLGATLWNIVVGLVNGVIQFIWVKFVQPIITVIEFIYNAFNGGFDGIGGAFKNLIGQMLSQLMSFAKIATKIIDAIFGTEWTAKVSGWQAEVESWGTNENYVEFNKEAPEFLSRTSATDAYNSGAEFGANLHNNINGWFDEKLGGFKDIFVDKGGIAITGTPATEEELLKGINNNTGDISKKMDLTADDLKYLRQLAEQEAINKFTTAEIKVDMVNQNNISKDTDMDAVVAHFKTVLEEELAVVAAGVHV